MIEIIFFYGNKILFIGAFSFTLAIAVLVIKGYVLKRKYVKVINAVNERRQVIDEKYFTKWRDFLEKYNKWKIELTEIRKKIILIEKKCIRMIQNKDNFSTIQDELELFMDIPSNGLFKKRKIRKALKTKDDIVLGEMQPQKRGPDLYKKKYLEVDYKKLTMRIFMAILICSATMLFLESVTSYGIGLVLFRGYWKKFLFVGITFLVGYAIYSFFQGCFDPLYIVLLLMILFFVPILINLVCFLWLNSGFVLATLKEMLNIFWLLLVLVLGEMQFIKNIFAWTAELKKYYLQELDVLNDLSGSEKMNNYEEAFEHEGDLEVFLDTIELNINDLKSRLDEIVIDKGKKIINRKNKDLIVGTFKDYKILEVIVLKRNIGNDYYNGFINIREVNRIFKETY